MSADRVSVEVEVFVDVDEILAPADLFTRAQSEQFQRTLYHLPDRAAVLEHWAYNAVANGIRDVSRLDGWADLPNDAVRLGVIWA